MDAAGDIFIADTFNNVVREVIHSTGNIVTVAGTGDAGYSGNGGPATDAKLNETTGVAVDSAGNLFIADYNNNVIREVKAGTITTVVGNGDAGYSGDGGSATDAKLNGPADIALDAAGNLFFTDNNNSVIREVSGLGGESPQINTVAGDSDVGGDYSGDGGPATGARLAYPFGIAADAAGNLFVADYFNNAVREIGSVAAVNTTIYLTASASSTVDGDSVTFTATVSPPYLGGNLLSLGDDTVDFYDGDTSLGYAYIDSTGHATLTTSDLSLGAHTITAKFTGDSYHAPSSSGSITETIVHDSSTSLSLSTSSAAEGSMLTLTATVSGEGEGTPTGIVAFLDGTTVLGYSPLTEGDGTSTAAFTTAYLAAGDHTDITAVYQGDSNFISSTSDPVDYDALPIVTPTLTSSTSEIVSGTSQTVTLTASVPSTASGTVTFMDGGTSLGSPQTLNNTATETDALLLDSADGGINTDLTASYPEMTIQRLGPDRRVDRQRRDRRLFRWKRRRVLAGCRIQSRRRLVRADGRRQLGHRHPRPTCQSCPRQRRLEPYQRGLYVDQHLLLLQRYARRIAWFRRGLGRFW